MTPNLFQRVVSLPGILLEEESDTYNAQKGYVILLEATFLILYFILRTHPIQKAFNTAVHEKALSCLTENSLYPITQLLDGFQLHYTKLVGISTLITTQPHLSTS